MNTLKKFYESLYDQVSEEETFQYSEGQEFPPLRLNRLSPSTSATSEDITVWDYRSHIEHDAFSSIKLMFKVKENLMGLQFLLGWYVTDVLATMDA
eukprot:11436307-Prorocentrum_lima.AAC.2